MRRNWRSLGYLSAVKRYPQFRLCAHFVAISACSLVLGRELAWKPSAISRPRDIPSREILQVLKAKRIGVLVTKVERGIDCRLLILRPAIDRPVILLYKYLIKHMGKLPGIH